MTLRQLKLASFYVPDCGGRIQVAFPAAQPYMPSPSCAETCLQSRGCGLAPRTPLLVLPGGQLDSGNAWCCHQSCFGISAGPKGRTQ